MHWIIKKVRAYLQSNFRGPCIQTDEMQGDDIFESQPIVMNWGQQKLKRKGNFTDVKQKIYEIETPDGVDPPMYFNDGMCQ